MRQIGGETVRFQKKFYKPDRPSAHPFFVSRKWLEEWAEICFVVRHPLAWRFTKVVGVQVHVRRTFAALFRISGTTGRIALKLGVWLGDH